MLGTGIAGTKRAMAGGEPTPNCLVQMVEGEIIPRLLLAHRQHAGGQAAAAARPVPMPGAIPGAIPAAIPAASSGAIDVSHFATQALEQDAFALLATIEGQLALGAEIETLFLDLVAPAARQLGLWWDQDVCDFVDVTMGLWRLQEVVHEISARLPGITVGRGIERCAFFTSPPGSLHGFGSLMVEEFFRRAGWTTWSGQYPHRPDMLAQVENRWFDVIGLTISTQDELAELPALIAALKKASRNPQVFVMVGGWVFNQTPALAAEMGADCTAPDARAAVASAESLVAARCADAAYRAAPIAAAPIHMRHM